jgi:hypothetical protein
MKRTRWLILCPPTDHHSVIPDESCSKPLSSNQIKTIKSKNAFLFLNLKKLSCQHILGRQAHSHLLSLVISAIISTFKSTQERS